MNRTALCLLAACAPKAPPVDAPPAVEPPVQAAGLPTGEPITPVQLHMSERFEKATAARDALIEGRLDAARSALTWMSTQPLDPGVPHQWGGYLDALQAAARAGAEARDAAGIGQAVAGVATACGGCHQAVGARPVIPAKAQPSADAGVEAHIERHLWAADRMWVSLVVGSDEAWREALQVLGDSPVSVAQLAGRTLSPAAQAHAAAVHDKARATLDDDDPDTRAVLYGEFVAACAGCHVEQGVGE